MKQEKQQKLGAGEGKRQHKKRAFDKFMAKQQQQQEQEEKPDTEALLDNLAQKLHVQRGLSGCCRLRAQSSKSQLHEKKHMQMAEELLMQSQQSLGTLGWVAQAKSIELTWHDASGQGMDTCTVLA